MSNLVTLSKDNWAELRPPEDVSERLRRPIRRALGRVRLEIMKAGQEANASVEGEGPEADRARAEAATIAMQRAGMTQDEVDALGEANDAMVVALVAKWSYDRPITLDNVLDLPGADYDKLREVTSARYNGKGYVDTEPNPDPASPTAPSNGSGSVSVEGLSTTPLNTGAPTD